MRKILLALLVVLSVVSTARADEATMYASGPYALIQMGAYGPSYDSDFSGYAPQSSFTGDVVLGYKINPMWAIQGEIGYLETEGNSGFQWHAMPVTVALRLGLPISIFEPYLLAGGGAYFYTTTPRTGADPIDEVNIGGYFGMGALVHIKKFLVGVEARYVMMDVSNAPNDGITALFSVGYGY